MNKQVVKRISIVSILPILGIFAIALMMFMNLQIQCEIHKRYELHCIGCGSTRMLASIKECNIEQAFRYNPFIFITAPIMTAWYIGNSIYYVLYNKIYLKINNIAIPFIWLILGILFMILRNTEKFKFLAPTVIK